jgi:hypothetical protein
MQQGYVQPEIAGALDRHFEWRSDYRAERSLGYALASALRQRLNWMLDVDHAPGNSAQTESTWEEICRLSRPVVAKRKWRAFFLAFTSTHHTLQVLRADDAQAIVQAGIPAAVCREMRDKARLAHVMRIAALALPLLLVCLALSSQPAFIVLVLIPLFGMLVWASGVGTEYARLFANRLIGNKLTTSMKLPGIDALEHERTFLFTPVFIFLLVVIKTVVIGRTPEAISAAAPLMHVVFVAALAVGFGALIISEQFRGHLTWLMAAALFASGLALWGDKLHAYTLAAIAGALVAMTRADAFLSEDADKRSSASAVRIIMLVVIVFAGATTNFPVIAFMIFYFAFTYGVNRVLLPAGPIATYTVLWIALALTVTKVVEPVYLWLLVLMGIGCVAAWHHLRITVRASFLS